jgi:hypothetical protein
VKNKVGCGFESSPSPATFGVDGRGLSDTGVYAWGIYKGEDVGEEVPGASIGTDAGPDASGVTYTGVPIGELTVGVPIGELTVGVPIGTVISMAA